jgi:hypothetical protein
MAATARVIMKVLLYALLRLRFVMFNITGEICSVDIKVKLLSY